MDICKSCEHFVSSTGSCGTLVIGGEVKFGRGTTNLCGCVMKVKTRLKLARCPINKWKRDMSNTDIAELKKAVEEIGKFMPNAPVAQRREMFRVAKKHGLTDKKDTGCARCVKDLYLELKRYLKEL